MPTQNSQTVHELIQNRWSPRAFSEQSISKEDFFILLKAAQKAASSMNEQPWRFVYAFKEDKQHFNRLLACLMESNQIWAKDASILMCTIAKSTFTKNNKPNAHAWHDVGLAVGNLSAQATAMGIYLHQMGGFYQDKAIDKLGIPEDYEPVSFIALGYLGDASQLPERLQTLENPNSPRKNITEFSFEGYFKKE